MPLLALVASQATPTTAGLDLAVEGLRNQRGALHFCLTRDPKHFPDCSRDPQAVKRSVGATTTNIRFGGFAPGRYALTIIHDENGNHKLDTLLGVPREGFGFSRNPVVRFGAPRFSQVDIELGRGLARASVRMQYLL